MEPKKAAVKVASAINYNHPEEMVKAALLRQAEACAQLAEGISRHGATDLQPEDKLLIRVAGYQMIDEACQEFKAIYLEGGDIVHVVERLQELNNIFGEI